MDDVKADHPDGSKKSTKSHIWKLNDKKVELLCGIQSSDAIIINPEWADKIREAALCPKCRDLHQQARMRSDRSSEA